MMDQHQAARLLEFESEYWNDSSFPYDFSDNASMVKPTIPTFMIFNSHSLTIVIVYCICFVIAAVGNLTVFLTLSRARHRKSRISLMIFHLSIADLLVAFFTIPIEIGWRVTVQWVAGNPACKVFLFLRAFGLYLSNNILICVSLDRYFAVLHPLSVKDARQRGRYMLTGAWVCSIVYAIPQSIVFHVEKHPQYTNFTQCVTFGSFPSPVIEYTYNVFCIVTMYFIPLVIICWVYCKILCEISSKSRESKLVITKSSSNGTLESSGSTQGSRMRLRRSDMSSIERARSRTLKMTIKIVVAFIFCWTPYITMNLWYVIDKKSAEKVDELIQASLFIMAVGNSCVNPLVYGSYAIEFKKECCRCFLPWTSRKTKADVTLIQRSLGGSKFQKRDTKSPGVSKQIVHSVRQAVHGLFKVGSGQTKSTAVCGKVLAPVSPRLSVSTTSRGPVEKMPLRTIKPIFKDTMPKSPCSEPIINDTLAVPTIQPASALSSPLDFSAVEPQTT